MARERSQIPNRDGTGWDYAQAVDEQYSDSPFYTVPGGSGFWLLDTDLERKAGSNAVIFELPVGASMTYGIITGIVTATAPPDFVTVTRTAEDFRRLEQPLGPNSNICLTALTGDIKYQWL